MASTTIHSLAYKITADTSAFTNGMKLTSSELRAAKKITEEMATPLERYTGHIAKLDNLLQKGAITEDVYNKALEKQFYLMKDAEKAAKDLATAKEVEAAKTLKAAEAEVATTQKLGLFQRIGQSPVSTALASKATAMVAGAVGTAQIFSGIKNATEQLDAQQDAARRLNIETDDYIRLQYGLRKVAELSNDEAENFLSTMRSNTALASRDMGRAKKLFEELGYSAEQLTDLSMKPLTEQFETLVGEINKIDNASSRALIVEKIFGTNASSVMEYIDGGVTGIRQLGDEIERLGGLQGDSAENIAKLVEQSKMLNEEWNLLWQNVAKLTSGPLAGVIGVANAELTSANRLVGSKTASDASFNYLDLVSGAASFKYGISSGMGKSTQNPAAIPESERAKIRLQSESLQVNQQMLDELKKQGRILEDNAR